MWKHQLIGLIAVNPEGGKEARAHAVSPQIEAGNV
jgi:phage terminase large subunit-like protein